MFTSGVALEEVAEYPSPGLILGKQESLFLFLDRLLHDFRLPLELQQVARDYADDADVPTANKEEYDVHSSNSMVELWDPPNLQIELFFSFEASSTEFSEDHIGEVKEKVQKQVQLLNLFEACRPVKKKELGKNATTMTSKQLTML